MTVKTERTVRYRNSSEIFAVITSFENCTLPPANWTPEAFLTVVFWYLYMNPLREARRVIRDGVRRYNFEHNIEATDKKNYETAGNFSILKVNKYLKQSRDPKLFVNYVNQMLEHLAAERNSQTGANNKIGENETGKNFDCRRHYREVRQSIGKQSELNAGSLF
jgi:hypothetical protein